MTVQVREYTAENRSSKEIAGSRTGEIMKNGTIIIGGNRSFMTGRFMMGSRIVVLGDLAGMQGNPS